VANPRNIAPLLSRGFVYPMTSMVGPDGMVR
jgi:hypothetical protein